jgi:uncharacterized protein (TIGR00369 family)
MNDVSVPDTLLAAAVPAGFRPIPLGPGGSFMDITGPLYGKVEGERLMLGFRVEPRHCNPLNICHGGMLMTFADMMFGAGCNFQAKLGRFLPTVNLTADFLAPAPLGAWVEGRLDVLRTTRNLVFGQGLVTADGTLVLRASGIMKVGSSPAAGGGFDWKKLLG